MIIKENLCLKKKKIIVAKIQHFIFINNLIM